MNPVVIGDSTYIPITPEQAFTLFRDVQLWYSGSRTENIQRCGWHTASHEDQNSRTVEHFRGMQNYIKVEDVTDGN